MPRWPATNRNEYISWRILLPRCGDHAPRTTDRLSPRLRPSFTASNPCNPIHRSERGIALVIVMISIMVLTILAAGFAYSMKVETKLARNANSEAELEWLGRSGVEYARWVLANSLLNPMQPYDSLDQPWATGSGFLGPTNNPIAEVQNPFTLGHGTVSWKITDLESKFNINSPEPILQQVLPQALTLMGVAPGEATPIVNSILDWIDPDDQTHVEGAETPYYQGLTPPYTAKNGPIDDISELLLIKGIRPRQFIMADGNQLPGEFLQPAVQSFWPIGIRRVGDHDRPDQPVYAAFRRQGQHQHRLGGSAPTDPGGECDYGRGDCQWASRAAGSHDPWYAWAVPECRGSDAVCPISRRL